MFGKDGIERAISLSLILSLDEIINSGETPQSHRDDKERQRDAYFICLDRACFPTCVIVVVRHCCRLARKNTTHDLGSTMIHNCLFACNGPTRTEKMDT